MNPHQKGDTPLLINQGFINPGLTLEWFLPAAAAKQAADAAAADLRKQLEAIQARASRVLHSAKGCLALLPFLCLNGLYEASPPKIDQPTKNLRIFPVEWIILPFGQEYSLFPPVGFEGNLSLLEIC